MRGNDDVNTILEICWVFNNSYLKNGNASSGNGNGFKMGEVMTEALCIT